MKPLCIYHGNCADGFGAAWVFKNYADREFDFHAGVYQNDPPDVTGRDVYLVDFSYKRSVVEAMLDRASRIVLIDHHKSAIDDLAPLIEGNRIAALTSFEHSGAVLAWQWFNGTSLEGMPPLLAHIEDRDLWRFALMWTREINANIFSYPFEFSAWDELMAKGISTLAEEGAAIERKHKIEVQRIVAGSNRTMTLCGHTVPVANVAPMFQSDVGHALAKGQAFAVLYQDVNDGRVYSLRSADNGLDVSEIAKQYGGGGHAHAAGFRVPYGHELAR